MCGIIVLVCLGKVVFGFGLSGQSSFSLGVYGQSSFGSGLSEN